MRRLAILLALGMALVTPGAHASEVLASCHASTPRVGSNGAIDDAAACVASFTTTTPMQVTTRIDPGAIFAGWAGLRVRGVNALWTQYDGYFAGDTLLVGQRTSTFLLQPGTWQLEVYASDTNSGLLSIGRGGTGTFGGSVSA